jgi:hypothetical protein
MSLAETWRSRVHRAPGDITADEINWLRSSYQDAVLPYSARHESPNRVSSSRSAQVVPAVLPLAASEPAAADPLFEPTAK